MIKPIKNCVVLMGCLLLLVNNISLAKNIQRADGSRFFQKAVPVWVDSRNVKKDKGAYVFTSSGRHDSKQQEENLTVSFRAKFEIEDFYHVKLKLAASSRYRVFINGEFLGHGPCVAGHGYYRVDEYKLKDKLHLGDNIIAIEVVGYNVDSYFQINQPAFLQAELTNNNRVIAYTDTENRAGLFEAASLQQRKQDVPRYSFQRAHTEVYQLAPDFQEWTKNWDGAGFQPLKLEKTEAKKLIKRRVKYPDYAIRRSQHQVNDSIYKFECNSTGFIGATFVAHTPVKLCFFWDEILNKDGDIDPYRLGCQNEICYELEPGTYHLESFEPYTLQYLKVRIESGDGVVSEPYIRQYVNGDVAQASFACSDTSMNRIFDAAMETYKQNALDIFMDCPHRERAGWLCDSYFTARVAFNFSGNTLIETNFLENFLLPESFKFLPKGMLPMCYPADHSNANYIPNWAMWYVLQLEEYVKRSGDHQMIVESRQRVADLLDFFVPYENEFGLLESLEKWVFVEWSKANKFVQDVNYPTNMLYASMLETAGRLYDWPQLVKKANRIRTVIREQAFDGQFFIDNAVRVDGVLVPQPENRTETCQYYAFFLETAKPESYPELWKTLVGDFGPEREAKNLYEEIYPSNAFIGNYLRLELLSRYGEVDQMVRESVKYFEPMAQLTGTLWENVHTRASLNHGFASHIAHAYYRDVLGVKDVDLVNKRICVELNEVDLAWSEGSLPLTKGAFHLRWKKKGNRLIYHYEVPVGYEVYVKNNTDLRLIEE